MIRLLVKTHNQTGLKYLCKREAEDWRTYPGSGKEWKKHLAEFGEDFSTELLFETEDKEEFKQVGIYYSKLWNIVKSPEWANLKLEEGDGGDTVSSLMWVTNGSEEKYIPKTNPVPDGWVKGRSDRCAFKDPIKQKALSNRRDRTSPEYKKKASDAARHMLKVRDRTKLGRRGESNPAKRPEVRRKISEACKGKVMPVYTCLKCKKEKKHLNHFSRCYGRSSTES